MRDRGSETLYFFLEQLLAPAHRRKVVGQCRIYCPELRSNALTA
jgi:hypothetical protein